MRPINRIIVHCSYTPPSMDIGADEIRTWHVRDNGWKDIGYHYVIRRDGSIEKGRPVSVAGAHAAGHNHDSIGVCLVGGKKEGANQPDSNFTLKQWSELDFLLKAIRLVHGEIPVFGHRDFDSGKTCPTFNALTL